MRRSLVVIAALAFLVPMVVVDSPQASAVKPIATYAYALTGVDSDYHEEILNDRVVKVTATNTQEWGFDPDNPGPVLGDWVGVMVFVNEVTERPEGWTLRCTGTFTGTVLGKAGTVTFKAVSLYKFLDPSNPWADWYIIDEGAIVSATGELKNMHGHFGFHEGWTRYVGWDIIWVNFEP